MTLLLTGALFDILAAHKIFLMTLLLTGLISDILGWRQPAVDPFQSAAPVRLAGSQTILLVKFSIILVSLPNPNLPFQAAPPFFFPLSVPLFLLGAQG